MNDSNFARSRTLFLLPFSEFRRSALFGVVAIVLTLSACGSDTAQESLIEAFADVEGLDVDIDDDTVVYSVEAEKACANARSLNRSYALLGTGITPPQR